MRKLAAIGLVVIGLVVGTVATATLNPLGVAGAQQTEEAARACLAPGGEPRFPRLAERDRRGGLVRDALDSLVSDGTIDESQRQAIVDRVRQLAEERLGESGGAPGPLRQGLQVAADTIGLSETDLVTALCDGQTLAQVAEANGVDAQAVVDALVATATERIDLAVADGRLTAERAEEVKAQLPDRIDRLVHEGFRR